MKAADLAARADRVAQIVSAVYGRVIGREGSTMTVEIPADTMGGAGTLFGMGGFRTTLGKQSTRLAERRVVDTNGNTVVCKGDMVTMAFYRYTVDLRPHAVAVADPQQPHAGAAAITRQVPPHRG